MLLAGMTRLPEGAVGNDLLSGQAAAAAKGACWSAGIERQTYLTPTASPLLPISFCSPPHTHTHTATTTPGTAHTSGWQIVNLASLKLMFFSTPLILICFPVSPFSLSLIAVLFSLSPPRFLSLSPPVSLFSLPLALEARNIKWNIWATVVILASVEVALVCSEGKKKKKREREVSSFRYSVALNISVKANTDVSMPRPKICSSLLKIYIGISARSPSITSRLSSLAKFSRIFP